jgi:hypothetical protein
MRRVFSLLGLILFTGLIFTSCTKDEDEEPVLPVVAFNQQAGFITGDATAAYGDTLNFGIILKGNGTDNLVKFVMKANGQTLLDSTINTQNFTYNFYTIKGTNPSDEWSFSTTDVAGNRKEESITITAAFGEINTYTTILMGAQDNATTESFLSLQGNEATLFLQAQAFQNQEKIDLFCFYENNATHQNLMALGSPGSSINDIFTGQTSPDNYTTKNLTRFYKTELTSAQFDAVADDAVLLDSYNADEARKKASVLTVNDVYAFRIQSGLTGLFKVLEVNGAEAGTLKIAIKIQKQ